VVIYADGADLAAMPGLVGSVDGWTTNPSLMRKAGVIDYRAFAMAALERSGGKPISFEVLAGDLEGMLRDARLISSWGENVFVKVPVLTPAGEFTGAVLSQLTCEGIKVNVTAVMTEAQVRAVLASLMSSGNIISIFAGRIADTGVDPEPLFAEAVRQAAGRAQILWASVREPLNVVQATRAGADIITLPPAMLTKCEQFGRDLTEYSMETVRQFTKDAEGITL
jgi:transaldolase